MNKFTLKLAVLFLILLMMVFLPTDPIFVRFLLVVILLVLSVLLFILFLGLTTDIKHGPRPTVKYKNIEVSFLWSLNGGGLMFAYEFAHIVSQKIGKVGHAFEYCSGPGFIGFNLLANNLCDKLTLADTNARSVGLVQTTIRNNHLEDRAAAYHSDCLDSIPDNEKWDLVVSNPPWVLSTIDEKNIMVCDPKGRVHSNFFRDIHKFLKPGGSILFIEGGEFTNVDSFRGMIEKNGLELVASFKPVSFLKMFKIMNEYQGLKVPTLITLHLGLFVREVYFIWVKKI